jgi:5-methylcytosine-specific restriction endonuclease McrA
VVDVVRTKEYRDLIVSFRAGCKAGNAPCGICGQRTIDYDAPANTPDAFEADHKISRRRRPDLALEPSNLQASHHRCNRNKGAGDASPELGEVSEDW